MPFTDAHMQNWIRSSDMPCRSHGFRPSPRVKKPQLGNCFKGTTWNAAHAIFTEFTLTGFGFETITNSPDVSQALCHVSLNLPLEAFKRKHLSWESQQCRKAEFMPAALLCFRLNKARLLRNLTQARLCQFPCSLRDNASVSETSVQRLGPQVLTYQTSTGFSKAKRIEHK